MFVSFKWAAIGVCVALLGACGSSNELLRAPVDVTLGQQLIDLKTAHSNGALSDREYDQQRKQLINHAR